ncbi:hypothetical protein BP5796_02418 [Coleophoma crateriformis]|uniref:Uncharacterized protein n=1 Tax=Coleophoma crateriformis TaxID=565419 RepID=A0A3D8SY59_9HELO|nr:hypothetical protein BP5796_02418 [Coleophoma crateriformis]
MALSSHTTSRVNEPLPPLHTPHRKRITKLTIGLLLCTLDLCVLPMVYYYAFKYGTNLSLQKIFAIITAVYGLLSFTHFFFRSLKLFRKNTAPNFRPLGWTRWGTAEFTEVNLLIVITIVEIELIAATAPSNPIVRLCAMPSPSICFYFGFVLVASSTLTALQWKLPFNMSSTAKGSLWRPALLAMIEDAGAIEGQGGVVYRQQIMKRYEVSPLFRNMIQLLSWMWGIGFLGIGVISTVLVMELDVDTGFGFGWGLPYAFAVVWIWLTMVFVRRQLQKERNAWRMKDELSGVDRSLA